VCTLIPYRYWAKNHNFHHAHNGQLEVSDIGDIEVFTTEQYAKANWKQKLYYRIYRNPFYLFTIGGFIYVVLYNRFAFANSDYFKRVKQNVNISNILFVAVYALCAYIFGVERFFSSTVYQLIFLWYLCALVLLYQTSI
ncbi:MAG TPA: fatty acid desaturase, partial [Chitinophagales bacterium]|nr:fatty acid desaturase [Chitinophagales bacterium]